MRKCGGFSRLRHPFFSGTEFSFGFLFCNLLSNGSQEFAEEKKNPNFAAHFILIHVMSTSRKECALEGFIYYLLSVCVLAVQFFLYLIRSQQSGYMDFGGWVYFVSSCLSHAAQIVLIPYLVLYLPLALTGWRRTAAVVQVGVTGLLSVLIYLNSQVYALYRFHINGFVLNLVFGEGAGEIFEFAPMVYVKQTLLFVLLILIFVGMWHLASYFRRRVGRRVIWPGILTLVALTLYSQLYHAYGAFTQKSSVLKSTAVIPFYYPLTANRLMLKMGVVPPANSSLRFERTGTSVAYPRNPLRISPPLQDSTFNIVYILIDSWNPRTLTADCMPNLHRFAEENVRFENHFSCSNGTRNSVFGMFFGLPGYYWDTFEADHVRPLLLRELLDRGYDVRAYSSATLLSPPFNRVVFGDVPNLRTHTPGETSCQRDSTLTADFLADLDTLSASGRPFFSFLFYDLPHAIAVPADKNTRFQPAWEYADYTRLNNDIDPEPFFNLYRNCCYEDDRLIGQVLDGLRSRGVLENTVVVVTGGHSQVFNEDRNNFWGHNGNFSRWQLQVPLILHIPGMASASYAHRTTHYDIVPTLMQGCLGVMNPIEDYSMGHLLTDPTPRGWHFAGSGMNYAFVIDDDMILEKKVNGVLEVTDGDLNPIDDYRIDPVAFDRAIRRLNSFYK